MHDRQLGFDFSHQSIDLQVTVMISLREQWHSAALKGEKRYEYRRKFIRGACRAYVYVTGNTRGVAAIAEFDAPIAGTPAEIADLGERDRPGSCESLLQYFGARAIVYAVPIRRYTPIAVIGLDSLRLAVPNFQPPQGYIFVDREHRLKRILEGAEAIEI